MTGHARRILSIDGGGMKGMAPAAFLAQLQEHLPSPLYSYFDLIAGTSTGALIAAGLATGRAPAHIVAMYRDLGPRVFAKGSGAAEWFARLRGLTSSKHSVENLRSALTKEFGDEQIGAARTRLLIPAWHRERQSVYVWKTRHHERFESDYKRPIVDALLSSATAPTFFSSAVDEGGTGQIDGGVWANNPMLMAAVEAIGVLKWDRRDVQILSLGCIDDAAPAPPKGGKVAWRSKAIDLLLVAQSRSAFGATCLLLDDDHSNPQRVTRLVTQSAYGRFELDSVADLDTLEDLGRALARERVGALRPKFFSAPAEAFQPVP